MICWRGEKALPQKQALQEEKGMCLHSGRLKVGELLKRRTYPTMCFCSDSCGLSCLTLMFIVKIIILQIKAASHISTTWPVMLLPS